LSINFPVKIVKEGLAKIAIPDPSLYTNGKRVEPAWAPVFYNPRAELSRDLSVCFLAVYLKGTDKEVILAEPLSATGVRGIRYVIEVNNIKKVFLNDIDKKAFKLIQYNVKLNKIEDKVEVGNEDASLFLLRKKFEGEIFDVIDLDPYGSSVPFLDAALKALKRRGVLGLTFTDTAVAQGVYPHKALKKYFVFAFRTPFSKELALRIFLGYVAREAAKYDLIIRPLFGFHAEYYVRFFVQIDKSGREAHRELLEKLGYIIYDKKTGLRKVLSISNILASGLEKGEVKLGPLWLESFAEQEIVEKMIKEVEKRKFRLFKKEIKILKLIRDEIKISLPFYYTVTEFAQRFKVKEPSPLRVVQKLVGEGFSASLTHFDSKGFKTTAPMEVMYNLFLGGST